MKKAINALKKFRDERDWEQFHDSKNLAAAISIEAAELNELYLWKKAGDEAIDKEEVKDELADILSFTLLLCDKHGFDPSEIVLSKIDKNRKKYPINKSKGTSTKYDKL